MKGFNPITWLLIVILLDSCMTKAFPIIPPQTKAAIVVVDE